MSNLKLIPCYNDIPRQPQIEDLERLMKHLYRPAYYRSENPENDNKSEVVEAWGAFENYKYKPSDKTRAHLLEELRDVQCMCESILECLARMGVDRDLLDESIIFVNTKNRLRNMFPADKYR